MSPEPFGEQRLEDDDDTSWKQYRRLVIAEMERLNKSMEEIARRLDKLASQVTEDIRARDREIWKAISDVRTQEIAQMKTRIALMEQKLTFIALGAGSGAAAVVELVLYAIRSKL